ncbi:MAG: isoprenylcysteine carboxylmethyltransferase family protein [Alphaproteobacteria bacterium]|nr:isoprenylcysteine carboxylmethyltransferase family protein [Alphaproteobacteria bacterium]
MSGAAETAGVIAPPPVLYLGSLIAGVILDLLFPAPLPDHALRLPAAAVVLVAGLALVAVCFRRFKAADTNVPTWMPTTALVTGGPYRISRNPIYLALTLAYLGLALFWGSLWPLVLLAPLLLVMRYGVIGREERYLEARFGDAYRAYRSSVRRWL